MVSKRHSYHPPGGRSFLYDQCSHTNYTKKKEERFADLLFVTNGIPSDFLCDQNIECVYDGIDIQKVTVSVPHFGILKGGRNPTSNESSPLTIGRGRHSQVLKRINSDYGVGVDVVKDVKNVDKASIESTFILGSNHVVTMS